MRIRGSEQDTRIIQLHLRSTSAKFECHIRPINPYDPTPTNNYRNAAVIAFDDTHEIDMLIEMLTRFKRDNLGYLGEWR